MGVREQFNLTAKQYDENRRNFIPCFDEFYEESTDFIIDYVAAPENILDLGAGTGLLSGIWYKRLPNAHYTLIDIADEMLGIARSRFKGKNNVSIEICDYTEALPHGEFDAVISGLSIHHIDDNKKLKLFSQIYSLLPTGGLFVNYDQFCADCAFMEEAYNRYWTDFILSRGLNKEQTDLAWERRKLDKECSVSEQSDVLNKIGFKSECIYQNKKFAVITAKKV